MSRNRNGSLKKLAKSEVFNFCSSSKRATFKNATYTGIGTRLFDFFVAFECFTRLKSYLNNEDRSAAQRRYSSWHVLSITRLFGFVKMIFIVAEEQNTRVRV